MKIPWRTVWWLCWAWPWDTQTSYLCLPGATGSPFPSHSGFTCSGSAWLKHWAALGIPADGTVVCHLPWLTLKPGLVSAGTGLGSLQRSFQPRLFLILCPPSQWGFRWLLIFQGRKKLQASSYAQEISATTTGWQVPFSLNQEINRNGVVNQFTETGIAQTACTGTY